MQCLETDLADLGDVASASCEVVLAAHTIDRVDDLGRLLRQVHRILKPSMPLVMSMSHPYADISAEHPYGTGARTIGEWFTALTRANFRVDQLPELGATAQSPGACLPDPACAQRGLLTLPDPDSSPTCSARGHSSLVGVERQASARSLAVMPAGRGRPNR